MGKGGKKGEKDKRRKASEEKDVNLEVALKRIIEDHDAAIQEFCHS